MNANELISDANEYCHSWRYKIIRDKVLVFNRIFLEKTNEKVKYSPVYSVKMGTEIIGKVYKRTSGRWTNDHKNNPYPNGYWSRKDAVLVLALLSNANNYDEDEEDEELDEDLFEDDPFGLSEE